MGSISVCPICEGKLPPEQRYLVNLRRANRNLREELAELKFQMMKLEKELELEMENEKVV